MPETIVEVQEVSKCYGGASKRRKHEESATHALEKVSFSVEAGEFVAIMGPSGSGKSTLLNCLATIDAPTSGCILVNGKETSGLSPKEAARFRREELGFIFQGSSMLDALTIRENIALALTLIQTSARKVKTQVEQLASRFLIRRRNKEFGLPAVGHAACCAASPCRGRNADGWLSFTCGGFGPGHRHFAGPGMGNGGFVLGEYEPGIRLPVRAGCGVGNGGGVLCGVRVFAVGERGLSDACGAAGAPTILSGP